MNINNTLTLLLFGTFIMFSCHSTKEIYEEDYATNDSLFTTETPIEIPEIITYKNATFNSKIKTVLCHKKEEELSLPILNLKAGKIFNLDLESIP